MFWADEMPRKRGASRRGDGSLTLNRDKSLIRGHCSHVNAIPLLDTKFSFTPNFYAPLALLAELGAR